MLQIWDFPGQIDFFDPAFDSEVLFGHCGALVFVIDAQVKLFRISGKPIISLVISRDSQRSRSICQPALKKINLV